MKFSIKLIRAYQFFWHPIKKGFAENGIVLSKCYYTPTCSNYAILVLEKHKLKTALPMIVNRLYRCHKKIGNKIDFPR